MVSARADSSIEWLLILQNADPNLFLVMLQGMTFQSLHAAFQIQ